MKALLLVCVLATVLVGVAVATSDGGGGMGRHLQNVGRNGPAWSKWRAYKALQAWKKAITDDPERILKTWVGSDVCNYTGVFCSPPQDPELSFLEVVAGIDLNGANLKGCLVPELGLLREIGIFHLNSNRFFGTVPESFKQMVTLFELDLSNNKLSGTFPEAVLDIPNLEFLDIRFNKFYGKLPRELFSKPLDAIFINNNNFAGKLPDSFGYSNSSAIVLANNNLQGTIPKSISNLKDTLQEIVALNNNFHGELPSNIGSLKNVHLFDYSDNRVGGRLPSSIKDMSSLETFDMKKNRLSGRVTAQLCSLDHLDAVILDDNFFNGVDPSCAPLASIISLKGNCIPTSFPQQKSNATCAAFYPPPPISPPPPPPPSCPNGYKRGQSSGTCFKLVKEPKRWDEAEFHCRRQSGGHLAAILNWKELQDVGALCSTVNETRFVDNESPRGLGCYVGGMKPQHVYPRSKGWTYPWSPCVKFNQGFWNDGEPNNKGGRETCLAIKYESEAQAQNPNKLPYMLNDLRCFVPLPFVCSLKRCDRAGCAVPGTCTSMGDKSATCSPDWKAPVGYKCNCSGRYTSDKSGTCIPKVHH